MLSGENPFLTYLPETAQHILLDTCQALLGSEKCCNDFVLDLNLSNVDCLKLGLSKGLGYGIIVASTLVKLPQVLKIFNNKSGVGIAVFGVLLELLAITFNTTYSYAKKFPFTAWGEAIFLLIETLMIAVLVLFYDGKGLQAFLLLTFHSGILYLLTSGIVPIEVLWVLQACNLPLAVSGKLLQASENYSNGHTGQVSAITSWLLFLGCIARVFTSIQETGDQLIVVTYAVASIANAILVIQVHYYWKATMLALEKMESSKSKNKKKESKKSK